MGPVLEDSTMYQLIGGMGAGLPKLAIKGSG